MNKEVSKAFREKIRKFLKSHSCTQSRLNGECVHNGYAGLLGFMDNDKASMSIDNHAIVTKSMEELRGRK